VEASEKLKAEIQKPKAGGKMAHLGYLELTLHCFS